jgi:hypothetical protein
LVEYVERASEEIVLKAFGERIGATVRPGE